MPIISIVMPAYNVEKYIGEAIESIIKQTFENWELIIVDDCSKDDTAKVVEKWQRTDTRIKCLNRKDNSGGARIPRFDGIMEAKGEMICTIDADDKIESCYLSKMLARQQETHSDMVLGRMVFCNETMLADGRMIPLKDYNMSQIFNGHEAVKQTLGEWEIAMNGMLVKADRYKKYVQFAYHTGFNIGYADDLDHRELVLSVPKVSMTNAIYYYRQQPNSVIHTISVNRFKELIAAKLSYKFAIQTYPNDTHIHDKVINEYFEKTYRCRLLYLQYKKRFNKEERYYISKLIKEAYLNIRLKKLFWRNAKQQLLILSWSMFLLLTSTIQKINKQLR